MGKAFLLVLTMFVDGSTQNNQLFVYQTHEECKGVGEGVVKNTIAELKKRGSKTGSVWFRCEQVSGLPISGK